MGTRIKKAPITESQLARVRQSLRARVLAKFAKIVLLFGIGLPTFLIGPLLVIGIVIDIASRWGHSIPDWEFWTALYILIPLLFWIECRTAGPSFSDTIIKGWTIKNPPSTFEMVMSELTVRANTLSTMEIKARGISEICLWGPRQIREGIEDISTIQRLRGVDRNRAAGVLAELSRHDQGPAIESLLQPGERIQSLLAVMAYLLFYDWIGVSTDGKRVWITSDSKAALEKA